MLLAAIVALGSARTAAAQELETETSRTLASGEIEAGAGFEYQISPDGTEAATPLFAEVGLLDRFELLVEPVVFTQISPKTGTGATGIGDVEVTATGRALDERPDLPAISLAAEVKLPSARNAQIGTGKTDVTGYLILSKRVGALDLHVNGGYTIIGKPAGITVPVSNIWSFALAGRYLIGERIDLFAEVLGNTGAVPEGEGMTFAEVTGAELVGTVGGGYQIARSVQLSLGLSLDNNVALLIHPGIAVRYDGLAGGKLSPR